MPDRPHAPAHNLGTSEVAPARPLPLLPPALAWALRQELAELAGELAQAAETLLAAPPELSTLPLDPPPPLERPTLRSPYADRSRR